MKMREHDFMGEERRPFKCSRPISVGAANQFMLAVGVANEFGVAKLPDDLFTIAFRNDVF